MAKNAKFKEEIAELRHKDVKLLMYGTFGFAGIALVIAFSAWLWGTSGFAAWLKWYIELIFGLCVVSMIWKVVSYTSHNKQERDKLIEQLDNQEQNPMPDNSTKEPTNQDIMNELKKAELRDRVMAWLVLGSVSAGLAFAGVALVFKTGWLMIVVGFVFFIISFLGVWRKWSVWW